MSEEQKETQEETASAPQPKDAGTNNNNHLAEKRGRMVASAVVAAVALSVIAVVVAGIFHWTAGFIMICPRDLDVNDPAPVLWKELEAKSVKSQRLGVPKNLLSVARFKAAPGELKEPGAKGKNLKK